jgi:hypothetical protein
MFLSLGEVIHDGWKKSIWDKSDRGYAQSWKVARDVQDNGAGEERCLDLAGSFAEGNVRFCEKDH